MVSKSLIDYVRTLLKQGYDIRTIRSTLRGAGYSQYDIQGALAEAQKPQVIHTKTLLIVFGILLVLTIIVILALRLTQPEPAELSLSLNAYKTQVARGDQLIMTAEITNPSGQETDAILDLETRGPQQIVAPSEEVTVFEKAAVPIAIQIPKDATIGQYTLMAKLNYDSKVETATQYFEITSTAIERPERVTKEERQATEQQECPGGCDDLDPCTRDECIEGQCVHTPITPCCGNGICEPGEEDCPDCKEDALSEAQREARNDPEGAAELCSQDPANADQCYKEVAEIAGDKKFCDYIQDSKWKDPCLMHFAYDGDYTVCEQLKNKYMKNSCISLKNLAKFK